MTDPAQPDVSGPLTIGGFPPGRLATLGPEGRKALRDRINREIKSGTKVTPALRHLDQALRNREQYDSGYGWE